MTIVRCADRDIPYTIVHNNAITDPQLSFKALGLLVYLLSKPPEWQVNRDHLATTHLDGVAAVRSALAELHHAGYARLEPMRGEDGRLAGRALTIYETPKGWLSASRETRQSGNRTVGNRTLVSKETVSTEISNNGHSPSLAVVNGSHDRPFEEFWSTYPRRVGKRNARQAWDRAIRRARDVDIIAGARRYAEDRGREDRFTAHPATWLNGDRWLDEPSAPREPKSMAAIRRVLEANP